MKDDLRNRVAFGQVLGWQGPRGADVLSLCHKLPLQLRTLGVAQTVATLIATNAAGQSIAQALAVWLLQHRANQWTTAATTPGAQVTPTDLITAIVRANRSGVGYATTEAIRWAATIKTFAKALL